MAKISEFNNLSAPSESAVMPIVDNAETRKVSIANLRKALFVPATTTDFGAVKVGDNLSIDENGVLSADSPTLQADWTAAVGPGVILNKPTLSAVAISNSYNDLSGRPNIPPAQIQADWDQSDDQQRDYIKNKPMIPTAQVSSDWNAVTGIAQVLNKPTIPPAQVSSDWNAVTGIAQVLNKPTLFSGSYDDLTNAPLLADVATTGDYADLSNSPVIPVVTTFYAAVEPTSSIGQAGDVPGLIFATSLFTYVCYGTYDGESNIWAKTATVGSDW